MSKQPSPSRQPAGNADDAHRRLFGVFAAADASQMRKRMAVSPVAKNRLALVDYIGSRELTVFFEDDAELMQILVRDIEQSNGRELIMVTRVVGGDDCDSAGRVCALIFDRKLRSVFVQSTRNTRLLTFDDVTWVEPVTTAAMPAYFIDITLVGHGVFRIGPPSLEVPWSRTDAEWVAAYIRGAIAPGRPTKKRRPPFDQLDIPPAGEGDLGPGDGGLGVPARRPRTPTRPPFGEAHVIPPEDADRPRYQ